MGRGTVSQGLGTKIPRWTATLLEYPYHESLRR